MGKITADYHVHSKQSPDGRDSMEAICAAALNRGLKELAFTDHYELFSEHFHSAIFCDAYLEEYNRVFSACCASAPEGLTLRRGLELGQGYLNPYREQEILSRYPFDYVIGSIHKLHDIDLGQVEYQDEVIQERCKANLELLYKTADSADFDCLGHLDIIKRYAAHSGIKIDLLEHFAPEVDDILRRLIARGKGLEINTSGLRQVANEPLPSLGILTHYRALGGTILTVGSDAHRIEDLGADFDAARQVALYAGFHELALYERRIPHFYSID